MEEDRTFQLIMRQGPQPGEILSLNKQMMAIGRDGRYDIVIIDPEVSRQHARLTLQPEGYLLEDLGSTNGTFVNGARLTQPHLLTDGDQVGLGETVVLDYQAFVNEVIETVMSPHAALDVFPEPAKTAVPPPPFEISSAPEPAPPVEIPFPVEPEPAPLESEPLPPPPTFSSMPAASPPPLPQFSPQPPAPSPSRPVTTARPVAPPSYAPEEDEKPPDKRRRLLIGCGCLLLLVVCSVGGYLAYRLGTAVWNAPTQFWDDPLNNLDLLFGAARLLLLAL